MWQRAITHQVLKALEQIEYGSLHVTTPDGVEYSFAGRHEGAHGIMYIQDWRTLPALVFRGDIGFAEAYRDGWWDADDLASLLLAGVQNQPVFKNNLYGSTVARSFARLCYLLTPNTLRGSKRNIHAHYDLGNEFYQLWLDDSMTYSSALFRTGEESLRYAQLNKYDRMLDRLNTKSGQLLEIGCGWGGLIDRATKTGDFNIKGITLSQQQHDYATRRVGDSATIALEDYRHQRGGYDHIISIEMFEAVGERFWPIYFQKLKSLLNRNGKAVIQTITIGDEHFERYRKGADMIRTFIFPGGMLPSPSRFKAEAEKYGLRVTDHFEFGMDYAVTLQHWLAAFESKKQQILALGFDQPFIRLWRFYLAGCISSFKAGQTSVMQVELQHA